MLKVNGIIRLRKKKECSKVYPFTKRFRVVEAYSSTSYHFFFQIQDIRPCLEVRCSHKQRLSVIYKHFYYMRKSSPSQRF